MKRHSPTPYIAASIAAASLLSTRLSRRSHVRRGQVAVITGGSTGLGLALAHRFGKAGLKLALAARHQNQLERARLDLLTSGSIKHKDDVLLVAGDLSRRDQAEHLIAATLKKFVSIDLLINDAGIIEVGPAENQPVEAYERTMGVNFFAALYTTYAVMQHMLRRKSGAICNISSIGGKVAVPHLLPYVAAKFALTGFSEGLNAELRPKGVRVTTVLPGLMRTGGEQHAHFRGQVGKEQAWFKTSAQTPGVAAGVKHAADEIFRAVDRGTAEITITPQAWLAARFAGVVPGLTQGISSLISEQARPAASQRSPPRCRSPPGPAAGV